jgi:hypothetical protein
LLTVPYDLYSCINFSAFLSASLLCRSLKNISISAFALSYSYLWSLNRSSSLSKSIS